MWFWTAVGLIAATYCLATGYRYAKQRQYLWAAIGSASGVLLLFMPVAGGTHAVKIDLPAASPR